MPTIVIQVTTVIRFKWEQVTLRFINSAYWRAQHELTCSRLENDDNVCSAGHLLTESWIHPQVGQLYSIMTWS